MCDQQKISSKSVSAARLNELEKSEIGQGCSNNSSEIATALGESVGKGLRT